MWSEKKNLFKVLFNSHMFSEGTTWPQAIYHTCTNNNGKQVLRRRDNTWSLHVQRKIMPNSHEGHRDTYKLLTLEGAPSKADGRQEVLCPGGAGGSREGIWRLQGASSTMSRGQCLRGGAFKAGENKTSQDTEPQRHCLFRRQWCLFGVRGCNLARD